MSWLNAIATHVCLKLLRTKKGEDVAHRQSLDDPATLAGVEENQSTTGSKDRVAEVVEKRLLEQQIRHRVLEYAQNDKPRWDALELDIFELYYIQGVETKREVAERLGENENKVKYRIYRRIEPVLKRVRQEFEAEHEAI